MRFVASKNSKSQLINLEATVAINKNLHHKWNSIKNPQISGREVPSMSNLLKMHYSKGSLMLKRISLVHNVLL
jgi:hypothetical protein